MERRHILAGLGLAAGGLAVNTLSVGSAHADTAASRKLGERFAETLTAHDIDAFAALFADDYANHQTSAAAAPPPPGKSVKELSVAYFGARLAALPDLVVVAEAIVASEEMVAASYVYTGTHRGTYFGVPATNRRISFNSCDILAVRDGKFVSHWGAADIAGLLAQLRAP